MSIKSDKWIRRMCTPPEGLWGMGSMQLPLNKIDGRWYIRENGLPVLLRDPKMRVEDCEEFTPIDDEVRARFQPMISPFAPVQIRHKGGHLTEPPEDAPEPAFGEMVSWRTPLEKIVSYGTSSYGYDLRCGNKFKIFTNINSTVVDPKNFDEKSFVDFEGDVCIIPPNSFALAHSVEFLRIPRNILTICLGKSTYARCGIIVNVTPLEPEWNGHVTLEFSNTTPLPAKIYANEGVAQILFFQGDETCATSYADRQGKYMDQEAAPVVPKV
jgi:dCTP deaminase